MWSELGWHSLQAQHFEVQMTMFYKIVNGHVALNLPSYISTLMASLRSAHNQQYMVVQPSINSFKYSFYPRTIRCWNILPAYIVYSPSVASFKTNITNAITEGVLYMVPPRDIFNRPRLGSSSSLQPGAMY